MDPVAFPPTIRRHDPYIWYPPIMIDCAWVPPEPALLVPTPRHIACVSLAIGQLSYEATAEQLAGCLRALHIEPLAVRLGRAMSGMAYVDVRPSEKYRALSYNRVYSWCFDGSGLVRGRNAALGPLVKHPMTIELANIQPRLATQRSI